MERWRYIQSAQLQGRVSELLIDRIDGSVGKRAGSSMSRSTSIDDETFARSLAAAHIDQVSLSNSIKRYQKIDR